jgi:hypothetical protein
LSSDDEEHLDADQLHMESSVDAKQNPIEFDGEDVIQGKGAKKRVQKANKPGVQTPLIQDTFVLLSPDPESPDKIWMVQVVQINPEPENEATWVSNSNNKWHYLGGWYDLSTPNSLDGGIHKSQSFIGYVELHAAGKEKEVDLNDPQVREGLDANKRKGWLRQHFDRDSWGERELMVNICMNQGKGQGKNLSKRAFPKRVIDKLASQFPTANYDNLDPRPGAAAPKKAAKQADTSSRPVLPKSQSARAASGEVSEPAPTDTHTQPPAEKKGGRKRKDVIPPPPPPPQQSVHEEPAHPGEPPRSRRRRGQNKQQYDPPCVDPEPAAVPRQCAAAAPPLKKRKRNVVDSGDVEMRDPDTDWGEGSNGAGLKGGEGSGGAGLQGGVGGSISGDLTLSLVQPVQTLVRVVNRSHVIGKSVGKQAMKRALQKTTGELSGEDDYEQTEDTKRPVAKKPTCEDRLGMLGDMGSLYMDSNMQAYQAKQDGKKSCRSGAAASGGGEAGLGVAGSSGTLATGGGSSSRQLQIMTTPKSPGRKKREGGEMTWDDTESQEEEVPAPAARLQVALFSHKQYIVAGDE